MTGSLGGWDAQAGLTAASQSDRGAGGPGQHCAFPEFLDEHQEPGPSLGARSHCPRAGPTLCPTVTCTPKQGLWSSLLCSAGVATSEE